MSSRLRSWLIHVLLCSVLVIVFGSLYFSDLAFGAWGDDSAGYIFLAGRLYSEQSLVYFDELGAKGLDFFGNEQLARWLIPTHNQFISPEGVVASKYPIGLSILMTLAALFSGSDEGFYLVNPLLATANIVLLYVVAVLAFRAERLRALVGFLAAASLGISNLYYDHAIAQPMREIPSISFLLLTTIFLLLAIRQWSKRSDSRFLLFTVLSGLSFGFAIDVRETSIVVLPAIVVYVVMSTRTRETWLRQCKRLALPVTLFCVSVAIGLAPTIWNSINISQEKVVFKPRDTSSVVLLSNIGHVQTLGLENVFDNKGKFRPGKGALPHYWDSIKHASPVHFFLLCAVVGLAFLWKSSRPLTAFFVLWFTGILTIFSLWINPYSRYILPLFPVLTLMGAYGFVMIYSKVLPQLWNRKWASVTVGALLVVVAGFSYQTLVAQARENMTSDVQQFKALAQSDLHSLIEIGNTVKQAENPVLLFSGDWQFGTSETFEAHTQVKTIRFPHEQRFLFDRDEVNQFFDQVLTKEYDLFVWVDETSSPEVLELLYRFETVEVSTVDFTFQNAVRIIKIPTQ